MLEQVIVAAEERPLSTVPRCVTWCGKAGTTTRAMRAMASCSKHSETAVRASYVWRRRPEPTWVGTKLSMVSQIGRSVVEAGILAYCNSTVGRSGDTGRRRPPGDTARFFLLFAVAAGPAPGADRVSMAVPGVPPVFSGWSRTSPRRGVLQQARGRGGSPPFDSGAAARRRWSPGTSTCRCRRRGGVRMCPTPAWNLVGISGGESRLAARDTQPGMKCADLKDQASASTPSEGARAERWPPSPTCGLRSPGEADERQLERRRP